MAETADRTLQINGQNVHVRTFGDPSDPPILLLPAMLDPAAPTPAPPTWSDTVCTGLAGGPRFVVRYDYEYDSAAPLPTLPGLGSNVVAVLDAVDLPAAHLAARSADAVIAGLVANVQPDRVTSVVEVKPDSADDATVRAILETTADSRREQDREPEGERAPQTPAGDEPTSWFEHLYRAAASGQLALPWERPDPHPLLVAWAEQQAVTGAGRSAAVVGCGTGVDAEYLSSLGFDTTGFDVAQTALSLARRNHPGSAVTYTTADLLDLPAHWQRAFDLVVEIYTIQVLPDPPRADAIANISRLVAPGGTLLAIAFATDEYTPAASTPPYPLTRAEIDAFGAADGLTAAAVERLHYPGSPEPASGPPPLWRAEFRRPAATES
jgi:SAM-dependent methyltransferase